METIKTFDGKQWDKNDILEKMLDDSFYYGYLGQNALSSSSMKKLCQSPKSYLRSLNEKSDSSALSLGRLTHLAVLEPHRLDDLHIIDGTKATKAYKEAVAQFGSESVYTNSEFTSARFISEAVWKCSDARNLLEGALFEVPEIGMIDGIAVRAKADALSQNVIIDLKTTNDPIDKWKWSAKNFMYGLQAALYMQLFQVDSFVFIVVNKESKDIGIFDCSGEFISSGWEDVLKAINNYKYFIDVPDSRSIIDNYVTYGTL